MTVTTIQSIKGRPVGAEASHLTLVSVHPCKGDHSLDF